MSSASSPHVLLACDFFVRYNAGLAGGLARAGVDATLLTRDHDLEFGGRPGAAAEFVARIAPGVERMELGGRVRSPRGLLQAARLRRTVRSRGFNVVHVQEGVTNDLRLLVAAGVRRGRFALTFHDPSPHPGDDVSPYEVVVNRALARAAGLIFVHGDALREELIATVRPRAPIVVVPHGVDAGDPQPPPAGPALLFFGRLSHYKGVDVLLDALPAVWRALPDATLTIAGAGDLDDHPALADPRVTLRHEHVPDDDVPGLIAAASCVVLPYRQASQSGVGSLVKRHARPLVVTEVGGLPELVADGSGLPVPPEDPERLGAAVVEVLGDRSRAARMAAAGLATAERGADWADVAELTLAAYGQHLLQSSRGWG